MLPLPLHESGVTALLDDVPAVHLYEVENEQRRPA